MTSCADQVLITSDEYLLVLVRAGQSKGGHRNSSLVQTNCSFCSDHWAAETRETLGFTAPGISRLPDMMMILTSLMFAFLVHKTYERVQCTTLTTGLQSATILICEVRQKKSFPRLCARHLVRLCIGSSDVASSSHLLGGLHSHTNPRPGPAPTHSHWRTVEPPSTLLLTCSHFTFQW